MPGHLQGWGTHRPRGTYKTPSRLTESSHAPMGGVWPCLPLYGQGIRGASGPDGKTPQGDASSGGWWHLHSDASNGKEPPPQPAAPWGLTRRLRLPIPWDGVVTQQEKRRAQLTGTGTGVSGPWVQGANGAASQP